MTRATARSAAAYTAVALALVCSLMVMAMYSADQNQQAQPENWLVSLGLASLAPFTVLAPLAIVSGLYSRFWNERRSGLGFGIRAAGAIGLAATSVWYAQWLPWYVPWLLNEFS